MFKKLTLIFACALSAVIVLTGCSEESSSGSSSSSSSSSNSSSTSSQSSTGSKLQVIFAKDPATACKNYLKYEWETAALENYDFRKNLSLLNAIRIDEISTNGDYAVVFYSIRKGVAEYRNAMKLQKNKDGYYIYGWKNSKNLDSDWACKMSDKVTHYTNDSVKLDTLFEESSSGGSSSKASAKIDQSSKEALLKSVATAIMNKDADTLWNLLSPDCQQQGITEYGSKEKTLEALKKLCDDPEVQKKVKETLSDKQKFAERMDNASNDMVQIDGKWYLEDL